MAKKSISCKIVADSLNEHNDRITTFIITFPRFLLPEVNTHRMFSRNSASSRARPFKVMLKEVQEDPFIPIKFLAEHTGMQGKEECKDHDNAVKEWLASRDRAVESALKLSEQKLSKQIINRVLEPFMWHDVIVTATDFQNFFALRAHPDAELHMAALAEVMLNAYNNSKPKLLKPFEWHIPFGDQMDIKRVQDLAVTHSETMQSIQLKIAVARCARLSYIPFREEDRYNYNSDIDLFNQLLKGGHMSPFEHCAQCMHCSLYEHYKQTTKGYVGNFKGFLQYRKTFEDENRQDERVISNKKHLDMIMMEDIQRQTNQKIDETEEEQQQQKEQEEEERGKQQSSPKPKKCKTV